jgi:8-oxo-dGTP pyrophosphatase MutT (NUDIX family)
MVGRSSGKIDWKHAMSALADFLAKYRPQAEETVPWDDLRLRVTSYLCGEIPPLELVTSVRAIVLNDASVIVVRAPEGIHLLPGGRREPGEGLAETLTREVLEETGWTIGQIQLIGIKHYHHLTPEPAGYAYPYPDFLQIVYRAHVQQHLPEAREIDGYEIETKFITTAEALRLPLMPSDHLWLRTVLGG